MTDTRQRAETLLEETKIVMQAQPKHNAAEVRLEKDSVAKWANYLLRLLTWGAGENEIAEACYQLEYRLQNLQEKVIMEILTHGTV
jgi:hypothetical protein